MSNQRRAFLAVLPILVTAPRALARVLRFARALQEGDQERTEALAAGADRFLSKGCPVEELLEAIWARC
jgi:DNA-binding NarL/FixJ family response regulator